MRLIRHLSTGAKIAGLFGGFGLGITAVCVPFVAPGFKKVALPFIPATEYQMKNINLAIQRHCTERDAFIDIGSGDGRVSLLGAETHTKSFGIEINRWLVYYAVARALAGGHKNVTYFKGDMWKHDFDRYERFRK